MSGLSFKARAQTSQNRLTQSFFRLMENKQTNLALSADVTSSHSLLMIADKLGPLICCLKTHIDIINDFTPETTLQLRELANKHQFFIFEDRKFADIGNTVKQQYAGGVYRIVDWADLTNAHTLPGPGIIDGLLLAANKKERGLILLAEMSSKGHLMSASYIQQTLEMAEKYKHFVVGFITQHALTPAPYWLNFTPGIQLESAADNLGQQYQTPEKAIIENGADVIIVGRGILNDQNILAKANLYRERGFKAYESRLK